MSLPGWSARRPRLTLRVTLLSLVLGLLISTVAAVALINYLNMSRASTDLERQLFETAALAATAQVENFLNPGPLTLTELNQRAQYGRLPASGSDALLEFLADRLRAEPTISQIMHADQRTGTVTSAWREADGRILTGLAEPGTDGGRPRAWAMSDDGTRAPADPGAPSVPDPRGTRWYRTAAEQPGIVWVGPAVTVTGTKTMAAATATRDPATQELRGAIGVQFYLDRMSAMLRHATRARPDIQAVLVARDGSLIASANPYGADVSGTDLAAALAALPDSLAAVPLDESIWTTFEHAGVSYAGAFRGFGLEGGLDWYVGFWVPEANVLQAVYESQQFAITAGVAFLLIGALLGILMTARISGPLRAIAKDLVQVSQFQLSATPSPSSFVAEVAVVSDATDRMKASLRSFARYVPRDLVSDLLARGDEAQLGGMARLLTIHFSDIENFTRLSEQLTPAEVVRYLAEYLDCMTGAIRDYEGTIDKFMGDGIMAFWNAPKPAPDHPARACRAALHAQARLRAYQTEWQTHGKPVFRARIGLHTGEALVGNFGTEERFAYTAMGDSVNLASRLEGLNKVYGTYILASDAVRQAAGAGFGWRTLDRVAVVGRTEGTLVSELLGERDHVSADLLRARDLYEDALAAYFDRRFAQAAVGFQAALAARPGDTAAITMSQRAEALAVRGPEAEWAGIYVATQK